VNTIHILYDCEGAVTREIAEFSGNGEKTQRFAINGFKNKGIIRLVFLPGSNFNLESIRFGK